MLAQQAIVVDRGTPGVREERLGRILGFFGVPWQGVSLAELANVSIAEPFALLGDAGTLADAAALTPSLLRSATTLFAYASDDKEDTSQALTRLTAREWRVTYPRAGLVAAAVATEPREFTGPMSGVTAMLTPEADDGVFASSPGAVPLLSAGGAPAFAQSSHGVVPLYVSATGAIVDLDVPIGRNYYDVKDDFLSAVPVVMFITSVFRDVTWRPWELGACLIIDDPLLRGRYGFCDFSRLRDLMREHWFTTNIAFIPWNWRRTSRRASRFFRDEADVFSVSVHGCDHVAAEFGAALDEIDSRARLAQARMRRHRARTRIKHDPIMVFPQGVFSADCPAVLKRHGFVAAVNTEVSPVGGDSPRTRIRDVWDTAILRYGSFPIYTRRYQHHGLENFAFDLLLGKPCFIVTHHEAFRDGGVSVVDFIDRLRGLNCTLRWRSPREVVRRAGRFRAQNGRSCVQMYGTELLLDNPATSGREFQVEKAEEEPALVDKVCKGREGVEWRQTPGGLEFRCVVPPRADALVNVRYRQDPAPRRLEAPSVRYEIGVAARRMLSEFRDEYVLKFARPA